MALFWTCSNQSLFYWGSQSWTEDSRWALTRAEGQNPLPRPAAHAAFDAAQDTAGLLGCERTLPGHVELLVRQHPQVLLGRAAHNPFSAQPVFVLWIALTHVQDLALSLIKLHEFCTGLPLN